MEPVAQLRADGTAKSSAWPRLIGRLVLLALVAWQGWMTLTLFGPDRPWARLLDDRPILSGRHPLHLYHGYLGARSVMERGTVCCYDPAFQAGYPKTPVFDSGSRPAELFLGVAGASYRPAAYKVGLALCCFAVPFLLMAAARGVGLDRGGVCLATAFGLIVWWGGPCRAALEAGDLDLLLAGLAAVLHVGLIVRWHRTPGLGSWVGLLASGLLGWFAQPLLFALLLPLDLVYYLSVGVRHRLAWHVALFAALAGGIAGNAFWLIDWVIYWWIRSPLTVSAPLLPHRTFHTVWTASLWGGGFDRGLVVLLVIAAIFGVVVLNETSQRAAARTLGLGAGSFLLLAAASMSSLWLARVGTCQLLMPALWFASVPAGHALSQAWQWLGRRLGRSRRALVFGCVFLLAGGLGGKTSLAPLIGRWTRSQPLEIGLGPERQGLIKTVVDRTGPEARILWEDRLGSDNSSRWTSLLPLLTDRAYLGGLDPDGCIEHAYPSLVDGVLAGRPIADWSDAELEAFCRRYNVGWVVCWSPASIARFQAWKGAATAAPVALEDGQRYLLTLGPRSFILKGRARLLRADWQHIALADVIPEDGEVVLSLHYQTGMHVSPSRVQMERDSDPYDPIPLIRLRVPGPVALVALSWEDR
jgi:hypothetical protein